MWGRCELLCGYWWHVEGVRGEMVQDGDETAWFCWRTNLKSLLTATGNPGDEYGQRKA